ncbi:AtpZ/AtpI family protein [Rhodopila sp.]|jgi:ATP synthase protein I|uniref:AtpZ/AtpI family protein n=1 Tax=Rhodopila sp. TaxID=2480087 RepID=UPI002B9C660E|nr:AtpZ/AtpI family protein [Rhodopila sp.]HVZ10004.1 AtpZ/AtpI family protein [Rhodopila sp.]
MNAPQPTSGSDHMTKAARQAAERATEGAQVPEPSLGARLGQIGVLGWAIVIPTLLALLLGHWLDRIFGTRVFFSAPLIMIGAGIGLWSAWKWMRHR